MLILVIGLLIFLGVHSLRIFADGWRTRMIARVGMNGWKGLFALVSIVGFVLIVSQDELAALEIDLDRHGLAHWRIGEVVKAGDGDRVKIG